MAPLSILKYYAVGKVVHISRIATGLIHASYRVDTPTGTYLLQRLHHTLANNGPTKDYYAVTQYLQKRKKLTQKVVKTKDGELVVCTGDQTWRLLTFIPGTVVTRLVRPTQARKLGYALGKFHRALENFSYQFRSPRMLHNTEKVYRGLHTTLRTHLNSPRIPAVRKDADTILSALPGLFLPRTLPLRVVHSDPKTSNFVFTPQGKVVLIDLDTCTRHSVLVDLGDALRSWCVTKGTKPNFRIPFFKAGLRGYRSATRKFLTKSEQRHIVQAIALIALELAARFLIDYFEDSYFAWDRKKYSSRRAHNLVRVQRMTNLYRDIIKKRPLLERIVRETFK